MNQEEYEITLNGGKTKVVISKLDDKAIRINAYGLMSILHIVPQANNCAELKVVRYKED